MTNGAVIFAQNNSSFDYVKLAVFSAQQIKRYLDIPVSLATDSKGWLNKAYPDHPFDKIIDIDFGASQYKKFYDGALSSKNVEWKNFTRDTVCSLTPYDRTLVIDSDYIINSDSLKAAFYNNNNFQIYRQSIDLAEWRDMQEFTRINQYSIPFYWATAFVFQKNYITEAFFNLVAYIRAEWTYFRALYEIESSLFRNDFAFSIAIHIMNGKTNGEFAVELPGRMTFIKDRDLLVSMDGDKMKFLVEKKDYSGQYTLVKTTGIDVHVMNKNSLSRYIDGGSGV
jgi:hypothetical protein